MYFHDFEILPIRQITGEQGTVMMHNCIPGMDEPLYGFVTQVMLVNETCELDVTCTVDGEKIVNGTIIRLNNTTNNESSRTPEEIGSDRMGIEYQPLQDDDWHAVPAYTNLAARQTIPSHFSKRKKRQAQVRTLHQNLLNTVNTPPHILKRNGGQPTYNNIKRQTGEEFSSSGPPRCRTSGC